MARKKQHEKNDYVEEYSDFVNNYVEDPRRLQSIYDENRAELEGTPGGEYIKGLIESFERPMDSGEEVCDIPLRDLEALAGVAGCLIDDMECVKQLVQNGGK